MTKQISIPTPAELLTAEATEYGYDLQFEYVGQYLEEVWNDETESNIDVGVYEYQAYTDGQFGVWAKISDKPELGHRFHVVFAEDGQDVDGEAYETLYDALRRIDQLNA